MKTSIVAVLMCLLAVAIAFKYPDMFQPKVALKEFGEVKVDLRKILKSLPVDQSKMNTLYADGGKFLKHYLAGSVLKKKLGSFHFKNCGDAKTDIFYVKSLNITPDPVVFPGEIDVSFNIQVKKLIDKPVKATVLMQGKKQGTIPCLGMIGSCSYDDFCNVLNLIPQCPDVFKKRAIPCKCPFEQGDHVLPKTPFMVDVPVVVPDEYTVTLNMTNSYGPVGCIEVVIDFK